MAENSYSVNLNDKEQNDSTTDQHITNRPSSVNKDRDDRLRQVRDRQNEERLRKLNEIKQQALQAQKIREQKEEERRKRIEDMRARDQDRRALVEERKKQIEDVERDRREYILRKNQEREARIESKKRNERCSSVFAFGSSTPRMLEPADTGGSSFWTNRRATSTTNMMFAGLPISRRSSERDVDGSKKRATSAGGLDRDPPEDDADSNNVQTPIGYNNRVARRRTDLMPTIPSPRDTLVQHTKPFTRSPGRAYSMTRLDQLAQPRQRRVPTPELDVVMEHRPISMTRSYPSKKSDVVDTSNQLSRSMSHLAGSKPLRKSDTSTSMSHLNFSRPMVTPRMNKTERMRRQRLLNANNTDNLAPGVRSGEATPSRPGSAMSGTSSVASGVTMRRPTSAVHTPPRRPRPASIAGTGLSSDYTKKNSISNNDVKNAGSDHSKPPIPHSRTKSLSGKVDRVPSKSTLGLKGTSSARSSAKTTPLQSPTTENVGLIGENQKSIPNTPKRKGSRQETASTSQPITNGDHHQTNKIPAKQKAKNVTDKDNNNKIDKVNPENVKAPAEVVEAQIDTTTPQVNEQEQVTNETVVESVVSESLSANNEIQEVVDNLIDVDSDQQNLVDLVSETSIPNIMSVSQPPPQTQFDNLEQIDMSASMIAKIRITTEEEAKAALAERRRLAREEAERQAELERQRLEEIARIQAEKERAEEEEQRRLEEETLRLAQQQREAEELRLRQAIEEAQRREEEERQRKIEEEKQKAEKEEQERKMREEAEKQRIELAAKLEKEEREREARRKRVEAIMSRTRGASANNSAIQSNNDSDNQQSQRQDNPSSNNQHTSGGEENNIVRNGTTITQDKQQLNKQFNNDNNTNNVLREVQLQSGDHQTPIINTRQLSVDGEFNSVVEQPSLATSKVPLNGSNVVHIFEQHISSNANPASVDVLINEDTINSNKSVSESSQQQSVTTGGDLA